MISQRRERLIVAGMLGLYLLLALAFSLGPIFEGPDEIEHYRFIRALAHTHMLPDPRTQPRSQYHQAPLYYAMLAPLALLADDADFPQIDGRLNPYYPYQIGIPGNDNKNLYLHTRAESFPYTASGTARAVHLIRLVSIALGACTILVSYAIFRLLWPDRPDRRLIALAVVAFTPQFLYLSSTINNDNLLYLTATLTLLLLLRVQRNGLSRREAVLLGGVLGIALLTKVSAVFLVLPLALAVGLNRRAWRHLLLVIATAVLIAGWWYVHNLVLYGDATLAWLSLSIWRTEAIRGGGLALDVGLGRLPYSYQTFWARFGQGAVPVNQLIYVFFDMLTVATVAGVLIWFVRHRRALPANVILVTVFGLTWLGVLIYYASTAWSGNQGRYLLPGIAAWGALIALGLDQWTPRCLKLPAALGGVAVLASIAAVAVFGYFLPAYRVSAVPANDPAARPLSLHFGGVAELIGMSPGQPTARPGETIRLSLYWRALRPTTTSIQTYVHIVDSDVVKRDSLPGTGNLLSTDWLPDETWAENYVIVIPPDAEGQIVHPLLAGLYDPAASSALPATNDNGDPVTPEIGRIAISGADRQAQETAPVAYRFGDRIALSAPQLTRSGDQIRVCLQWQSLAPVAEDYSVFLHVLSVDGSLAGQADFQPTGGRYPTGVWTPGDVINDCAAVDAPGLPPTGWRIALGLYNPLDNQRLPVQDDTGRALPDDTIILLR